MKMRLGFLVILELYTLSNKKICEDKFIHIQYILHEWNYHSFMCTNPYFDLEIQVSFKQVLKRFSIHFCML